MYCKYCLKYINEADADFCPHCGKPQKDHVPPKHKMYLMIILALFSVVLLSKISYKLLVPVSLNQTYESSVVLGNVIAFENAYWKSSSQLGSSFDKDKVMEYAFGRAEEDLGENQVSMKNDFKRNTRLYRILTIISRVGLVSTADREPYDAFFDAYIGMYNIAISPSGDRYSFVEKFNRYVDTIQNSQLKLGIFPE